MVAAGAAGAIGVTDGLSSILAGRDIRWYKGHYLRLTMICVS